MHGAHRYGTPREPVMDALAEGRAAILEIDLQGARQVRQLPERGSSSWPPRRWDELIRRLVGRGTESEEQRERRLETARAEMAAQAEFNHVIVNGEIGQAVEDLVALLGL